MRHNNFQKKTSTKQPTHNPHFHPVNGTLPLPRLLSGPHARFPTDKLMRTSRLGVLDGVLGLQERQTNCTHLFFCFFLFLILTRINTIQFFVFKDYFNL